jgi:hypothetical protein
MIALFLAAHDTPADMQSRAGGASDDLPRPMAAPPLILGINASASPDEPKTTSCWHREPNSRPQQTGTRVKVAWNSTTVENLKLLNEASANMVTFEKNQLIDEPEKLISGNELAEMLGVTEEVVQKRLQAGKLIAILRDGGERGCGLPIFQAWDGIAGAPLEQVLKAIGYEGPGKDVDAADAFQFFVGRNDLLGGSTPVEVLTGAGVHDPDDIEAAEFFGKPDQERLEFVISVAHTLAEARDA